MIASDLDLIRYHEGKRNAAYQDSEGVWTCGYGCTGPDIGPGTVWTDAQCESELALRVQIARQRAQDALGQSWATLDEVRQGILTDIAYQIGGAGLRGFPMMLGEIKGQRFVNAAHDMLTGGAGGPSKLMQQTPHRALTNADALIEGIWPQT